MSKLRGKLKSSTSSEAVDCLDLCKHSGRSIEDLVSGKNLLNKRQCVDLSTKLSKTTLNIRELVNNCGEHAGLFGPALADLYRYLEKAKVLVSKCGEEDWCAAAVFQMQNENAFREILLDISFCYNAIYEIAKSVCVDINVLPEDLRKSSVFKSATDDDIRKDQVDLEKRLDDFAKEPRSLRLADRFQPDKQRLAEYLLVKLKHTSYESQVTTLDSCSDMVWTKESEPPGSWEFFSRFLGSGSGGTGVCSTKWMGIPCAKKTFHLDECESSFLKEAGILAYLNHPCVINFFCCANGQARGDRFITMELMEKSLSDLIADQKDVHFSLPVVVDIIVQIARGMFYLHDRGVAHRDLKPQNVVVNRLTFPHLQDHFDVKLVDFGMSRTKVQASKSNTVSSRGIGTTIYRAPEVHPKANPNGRSKIKWLKADVFSFAMTCAHLLSLKAPFGDMPQLGNVYNELKGGRRPELPEGCPQELVALISDCWHINPDSRPSFKEVCTRLERFRYNLLRKFSTMSQDLPEDEIGPEFIKLKLEVHSSIQRPLLDHNDDGVKDEFNINGVVSIIPCTCGRDLELLPQPPTHYSGCCCNICWEDILFGDFYHCKSCEFDAHQGCAELVDEVDVFFHHHPLHLLVQYYYSDNADATCCVCQESLQDSEWVYRCEGCDFDVHALCTKYSKKRMWRRLHRHPLTLIQCPPRKNFSCTCCNGDIIGSTWRYTCTDKRCSCDVHPYCAASLFGEKTCIFDNSHQLDLVCTQRSFDCSRCGEPGFSWFYQCNKCDADIHLDCVGDLEEAEENWIEVYEKLMLEYEFKDGSIEKDMVLRRLDVLSIGQAWQANSSPSSSSPSAPVRVRPTIQRFALSENITPTADAFQGIDLRRKIAAQFLERRAKKMAAKTTRSISKAKLPGIFEKLEKYVLGLQTSGKMSEPDAVVLATTLKNLKKRQYLVEEEKAQQMQSKIRQGPRICLFHQNDKVKLENTRARTMTKRLLTSLRADMEDVRLTFLCEEPGHQHGVQLSWVRFFRGLLGEELSQILQPLLAPGLQVVRAHMRSLAAQLPHQLESVNLPNLGSYPWDLRDIDQEIKCGKLSEGKENEAEQKRAEDAAAEWILSNHELVGESIYKFRGLLRVRYLVTEEGTSPRYRRGTLAWLCSSHLNLGLEAGILQAYPVKYYHNELL